MGRRLWTITLDRDGHASPYLAIIGTAEPAVVRHLYDTGTSGPLSDWWGRSSGEPAPPQEEFTVRYWDHASPIQVTHHKGKLQIIVPARSSLVGYLRTLAAGSALLSEIPLSAYGAAAAAHAVSYEERPHLRYLGLGGHYTENDRKAIAGKKVNFSLERDLLKLGANMPPSWHPSPFSQEFSPELFHAWRGLAIHVDQHSLARTQRTVWDYDGLMELVQCQSGWSFEEYTQCPPWRLRPLSDEIAEQHSWSHILSVAQQQGFTFRDSRVAIRKAVNLLFDPENLAQAFELYRGMKNTALSRFLLERADADQRMEVSALLAKLGIVLDAALELHLFYMRVRPAETPYPKENVAMHIGSLSSPAVCTACGQPFFRLPAANDIHRVLRGASIDVCGACIGEFTLPFHGRFQVTPRRTVGSREEAIQVIQRLYALTGVVPGTDLLQFLSQVPVQAVPEALRLYVSLPVGRARRALFPRGWTEIVAHAGLLGATHGPFGQPALSRDGHLCRSLAEKFIDDWLYDHGLEHEVEPHYPYDPVYNTTNLRADFLVGDVWIEYFGLTNRETYAAKMVDKQALAKKHGLKLIAIFPDDLDNAGLMAKLEHLL